MQVDLSDKNIYDLIQRSDNKTIITDNIVDNNINENKKINIVKECKKENSLFKFIRNLLIIIICLP
jgi:hypothetical protein